MKCLRHSSICGVWVCGWPGGSMQLWRISFLFLFSRSLSTFHYFHEKKKQTNIGSVSVLIDSRTVTLHRYFFIFIINIIIIIIISLFLSLPLQRKLVIRYMQLNLQQVAVTRRKSLCVASNYWYFTLLSLEHLLTLFFFVL